MKNNNNHTICAACDGRLKSLERIARIIVEAAGLEQKVEAAADLEAVLDECNQGLNFTTLYEYLENKHKNAEVAA